MKRFLILFCIVLFAFVVFVGGGTFIALQQETPIDAVAISAKASSSAKAAASAGLMSSLASRTTKLPIGGSGGTILTLDKFLPFDADPYGKPYTPSETASFEPTVVYSSFTHRYYGSMVNIVTNNRALFEYNPLRDTVGIMLTRDHSLSFQQLFSSSDGRLIAFSDGGKTEVCQQQIGIGILDLKTGAEHEGVMPEAEETGVFSFEAWKGPDEFSYHSELFADTNDCLQDKGQHPNLSDDTYTLKGVR